MQRHAPNRPIFQSRQFVGAAILIAAIGLPLAPTGAETETPGAKTAPDDSWVILTGKVSAVENSQFILDYDGGNVAVDMGDWNVYDERKAELEGKRITVAGIVDRSDPDHPSIDANSVMYDGIYRYANAADEEGGYYAYPMETLARNANLITARGVVKQVWANEFTLGTRLQDITVNVTGLSENPLLGDDGEPRVEEGDKVSVFGSFDRIEVFDPQKIRAKSVVLLRADGNRARDLETPPGDWRCDDGRSRTFRPVRRAIHHARTCTPRRSTKPPARSNAVARQMGGPVRGSRAGGQPARRQKRQWHCQSNLA